MSLLLLDFVTEVTVIEVAILQFLCRSATNGHTKVFMLFDWEGKHKWPM